MNAKDSVEQFLNSMTGNEGKEMWSISYTIKTPEGENDSAYGTIAVGSIDRILSLLRTRGTITHVSFTQVKDLMDARGKK